MEGWVVHAIVVVMSSSWMGMRVSVLVVVGLLVAVGGRPAIGSGDGDSNGDELRDSHGLRMGLGHLPRCVVLPRQLRSARDCDPARTDAIASEIEARFRAAPGGTELVAVVSWSQPADQPMLMIVASMPPKPPAEADIRNYLAGVYNGSHPPEQKVVRISDPRLAFERLVVRGVSAIRHITDFHGQGKVMAYLLFGANRTYTLQFIAFASEGPQLPSLVDSILATITLPAAAAPESDPAYILGSLVGAFLLTGLVGRLVLRRYGRSARNALIAFAVAGGGSAAIGLLTMAPKIALLYPAGALLWLVADLVRLPPPDEPVDS